VSDPTPGEPGDRLVTAALTLGGLGHLRPAPGTIGSLPPVLLALGMAAAGLPRLAIDATMAALVVLASAACLAWTHRAERRLGRPDPGEVIADEVAGQSLALLLLPWIGGVNGLGRDAVIAAVAFAAFRLFDVTKPGPIDRVQRWPGGRGVLADDLVAGLAAAIVVQIVSRGLL